MAGVLFTSVRVIDAVAEPFLGEVLVVGERIKAVAKAPETLSRADARIVDGSGHTLMPGLVEAHAHLSFLDFRDLYDSVRTPVEEHLLGTIENARLLLDHGFTSCFSAAAAKPRLDVVVRDAIEAGRIPGPRLRAATQETTPSGNLGDLDSIHLSLPPPVRFAVLCDSPDAFRAACRMAAREGVDTFKINISGDRGFDAMGAGSGATVMTDDEVATVVQVARARGLDLLESVRERVFVAPAIGFPYTLTHEADRYGVVHDTATRAKLERELEAIVQNANAMRRRGIRVLPGGDYGLFCNPQGTNARDLEHFVQLLGFTPLQAIVAATRHGGELMGLGDELGRIEPGCLADLLLVKGDPLADIRILQDASRLTAIMKNGEFHKQCAPRGEAYPEAAD